jgi:hypothetical protein
MSDEFPADVKDFIRQSIHSLAQLEVLLMLRGEPERVWTAEDVAKILYMQPPVATDLLVDLVRRGLAAQADASFHYQPANDALRDLIERLAQLYHDRRVAVTTEIYSKPVDFVKAFADAFRLRKEE